MIKINYKTDNTYGNTMYEFINKDKIMKWFTDRSGDLYWALFTKNIDPDGEYEFTIGIQNYKLYRLIENLYNDFKNGEIFYQTQIDSELKYNAATLNKHQTVRDLVRQIYNTNTNQITWYSDEDHKSKANSVRIIKGDNRFIIKFNDVIHGKLIRVCFNKNRSYYGPCSLPFIRAYEEMSKIKDNYETSFEEYFNYVKPTLEKNPTDLKIYTKKSE